MRPALLAFRSTYLLYEQELFRSRGNPTTPEAEKLKEELDWLWETLTKEEREELRLVPTQST